MNKSALTWLSLTGIIFSLILLVMAVPTMAAPMDAPVPQYTAIASPTPGPDWRIIYIVQDGDTLWRISAITGISLDELRRLNNLTAEDIIKPGDRLLLGLGGPSDIPPTAGPPPTPTSSLPCPDCPGRKVTLQRMMRLTRCAPSLDSPSDLLHHCP